MAAVVGDVPEAGPSDPVKAFGSYVASLNNALSDFACASEERRVSLGETSPMSIEEVDGVVDGIQAKLPVYEHAQDVIRVALEKALESAVLGLPQLLQGWQDDAPHFLIYEDLLDVLLTFVDRQLVEPSLAATALEILFEAQSVQHAEQLFHYLETRMDRLTKGMVSGKGKALIFLRTLNDLLRRLSKSTHTVFCGRILLFLASIFPLGERSGVNLRGEFNKENVTTFEVVTEPQEAPDESEPSMKVDAVDGPADDEDAAKQVVEAPEDGEEVEDQMTVDSKAAVADSKLESPSAVADRNRAPSEPDFYTLFWSLQTFFSDPRTLFQPSSDGSSIPQQMSTYASTILKVPQVGSDGKTASAATGSDAPNLTLLHVAISKVLDVFADASKKEKALQGGAKDGSSRSHTKSASAKPATEDDIRKMFFYPKYLTSHSLIDLEIADGNFRKQFLVQCLILFQYLHSFTESSKLKLSVAVTVPNRASQLPFRLSEADDKWVGDLEARTYIEISRTPPDGEQFVRTVRTVLQGERNWSFWKANACQLFEKPPLPQESINTAQEGQKRLRQLAPLFPHKAGTPALSRLWQKAAEQSSTGSGNRKSHNLEQLLVAVKRQNELIAFRKEELAEDRKADVQSMAADLELQNLEERKASLAWRSLRILSATQLHLFGKIGVNDVEKLMQEMDKSKASVDSTAASIDTPSNSVNNSSAAEVPVKSIAEAALEVKEEQPELASVNDLLADKKATDVETPSASIASVGYTAEVSETIEVVLPPKRQRSDDEMDVDDQPEDKKPKTEA